MKFIKDKIVFLDGAMGTSLVRSGAPATPESSLSHPGVVKEITKSYINAGSDIVETNTFSATQLKYKNYREINRKAVKIAKKAVREAGRKNVLIAGSVGPTGKMVKPAGSLDFEEAVKVFKSQIKVFKEEGLRLLIIETMDDIAEMKAALIAAKEVSPSFGIIATMTFSERERTSTGTPPEAAAAVMDSLGADVIGVNCSFGPESLAGVVRRMRRVTKKPVAVQANAGIPVVEKGETVFPLSAKGFASQTEKLIKAGASYVGGCCGTTENHIKELVRKFRKRKPAAMPAKVPLVISSRTNWAEIGEYPLVIGERINFLAKPSLKNSDREIINEGLRQKKAGAGALDVNLGRAEDRTWEVAELISRKVDIPVVLDSQNPEAVEEVARKYPGVILLNSISLEKNKLKALLPVAVKYGIPFIGLCVDDEGVPKTVNEKVGLAGKIVKEAAAKGVPAEKIVIDPVTLAVSSDTASAAKTLQALGKITGHTVLGISNVSSGFPQKALLNEIFSALAVSSGISALIVNPLDTDLMYAVYAASLLSGRDKGAKKYLDYFSPRTEEFKFEDSLSQAVLEGDSETAASEARKLLKKKDGLEVINKHIVPALDKVGSLYSGKKIFLPQLIESAKASEQALNLVERKLKETKTRSSRGKIIIATVKGDIHDIGKNLVALMLKNHSFEVKDLGVDVDSKKIVSEAKKQKADIIALSSLMTTTMGRMQEVIRLLKNERIGIPVIIGGAAVTGAYAREIGAEYGKDAVEAVRTAGKLVEK